MVGPMRLDARLPKLHLRTSLPKINIDARDAMGDIGLRPIGRVMRDEADTSQQRAVAAIGDMAREGDRLARVEQSANAIAEAAADKWPPVPELNVDYTPKHKVNIGVEAGEASTEAHPARVRVDFPHIVGTGRNIDVLA